MWIFANILLNLHSKLFWLFQTPNWHLPFYKITSTTKFIDPYTQCFVPILTEVFLADFVFSNVGLSNKATTTPKHHSSYLWGPHHLLLVTSFPSVASSLHASEINLIRFFPPPLHPLRSLSPLLQQHPLHLNHPNTSPTTHM